MQVESGLILSPKRRDTCLWVPRAAGSIEGEIMAKKSTLPVNINLKDSVSTSMKKKY